MRGEMSDVWKWWVWRGDAWIWSLVVVGDC